MVQKKGSVSYPDKEYQIHREQHPQRKILNIKGKTLKLLEGKTSAYL